MRFGSLVHWAAAMTDVLAALAEASDLLEIIYLGCFKNSTDFDWTAVRICVYTNFACKQRSNVQASKSKYLRNAGPHGTV
jgi:hypothetical protein